MPAPSVNDKFRIASGSTRPVTTSLSLPKASGATTCTLNDVTGWNTTTGVDYVLYRRQFDTAKNAYTEVAGSRVEGRATLAGSVLSAMTFDAGTEPAAGYPADGNSMIYCAPTAQWADDLVQGLLVQHNQDGTHAAVTATSLASSNGLTVSSGSVALPNAVLTPNMLNLQPRTVTVATNESTASTTYTDLTTITDTVTATIGSNGLALVTLSMTSYHSTTGGFDLVSFAMSGTNTLAASANTFIIRNKNATANQEISQSKTRLLTGLTPGITTFKMKYSTNTGTANFYDREISVIPL